MLTCTGALSRNRAVGIELGSGRELSDILCGNANGGPKGYGRREPSSPWGLDMGSSSRSRAQMAEVLAGRKEPRVAVEDLMLRRQRSEVESGRTREVSEVPGE